VKRYQNKVQKYLYRTPAMDQDLRWMHIIRHGRGGIDRLAPTAPVMLRPTPSGVDRSGQACQTVTTIRSVGASRSKTRWRGSQYEPDHSVRRICHMCMRNFSGKSTVYADRFGRKTRTSGKTTGCTSLTVVLLMIDRITNVQQNFKLPTYLRRACISSALVDIASCGHL